MITITVSGPLGELSEITSALNASGALNRIPKYGKDYNHTVNMDRSEFEEVDEIPASFQIEGIPTEAASNAVGAAVISLIMQHESGAGLDYISALEEHSKAGEDFVEWGDDVYTFEDSEDGVKVTVERSGTYTSWIVQLKA